jgi:hypothetical protein
MCDNLHWRNKSIVNRRSASRHSAEREFRRRSQPRIECLDVRVMPTGGVSASYSLTLD